MFSVLVLCQGWHGLDELAGPAKGGLVCLCLAKSDTVLMNRLAQPREATPPPWIGVFDQKNGLQCWAGDLCGVGAGGVRPGVLGRWGGVEMWMQGRPKEMRCCLGCRAAIIDIYVKVVFETEHEC